MFLAQIRTVNYCKLFERGLFSIASLSPVDSSRPYFIPCLHTFMEAPVDSSRSYFIPCLHTFMEAGTLCYGEFTYSSIQHYLKWWPEWWRSSSVVSILKSVIWISLHIVDILLCISRGYYPRICLSHRCIELNRDISHHEGQKFTKLTFVAYFKHLTHLFILFVQSLF